VQWPEWASTSYRGDTSLTFFQGAEDLQVFVDWLLHQVPISEASERLYGWVGLDQATQRTGH
jgi:hypothetical protein